MQLVKLVNRTSRQLRGTWDGKIHLLAPHAVEALPRAVAEAIRRQNPIMGSEDPYDMTMEYLVGIEEEGDPISELTDLEAFPQEIERWNRKKLAGDAAKAEPIAGRNGLYAHERNTAIASDGQASGGFVNPTV